MGGATIYTVERKGYSEECPNVGRLLSNVKFTLRGESEMMAGILDRHEQPDIAAAEWLKANPTVTKAWLEGVLTFDGKPANVALAHAAPPPRPGWFRTVGHQPQDSRGRCHGGRHRDHQDPRHFRFRRHFHR
jgi:hypothetical protein